MPRNASCTDCPLHQGARTVCMWGAMSYGLGSTVTGGFIVGEAPGREEDRQGRPFVGTSGDMLHAALGKADLTDYYLTNAVKCRPAGNKLPPASVKPCAPYLDDEIATRTPKAILAVGATAWKRLGGSGGVTENAGKEIWSDKYQCWIMPVLHPASLLHSGTMNRLPEWEASVARYAHLLKGTLAATPPVLVKHIQSIGEASDLIDALHALRGEPDGFAFDFETRHLPWWHLDNKVISMSFSYEEGVAWSVPLEHPQSWMTDAHVRRFFTELDEFVMRDPEIRKTGHNSSVFDDLVYYRQTGHLPYTTMDTLPAWHLLNENAPKGLKFLERLLLDWPDTTKDTKSLEAKPLEEVLDYNGYDAAGTFLIRKRILVDLAKDRRLARYFSKHLMPGMRALSRIIASGIHVDQMYSLQLVASLTNELNRRKLALPVDNPGSTKQLREWLYDQLKLPVWKHTPGGAPATDEDTLNRLALDEPRVRDIISYRGAQKNLTTYVVPVMQQARESFDGRVHPDYHIGPETGRLGSRFHTEPRDTKIRGRYTARAGVVLLCADQKQVEARIVAWHAAGCPTEITPEVLGRAAFLRAFLDSDDGTGPDPYRKQAATYFNITPGQVTSAQRQDYGKVPVLASLYRISPEGLRAYAWEVGQLALTGQQAHHMWSTFRATYPEVPMWHDQMAQIITARGWVTSAIGRKRRLPEVFSGDGSSVHKAVNSGINFPIQSLAWDITWAGIQAMHDCDCGAGLVGTVHDQAMLQVEDTPEMLRRAAEHVTRHMEIDALDRLRPLGLTIPQGILKIDLAVGRWGSKQTVDEYLSTSLELDLVLGPPISRLLAAPAGVIRRL